MPPFRLSCPAFALSALAVAATLAPSMPTVAAQPQGREIAGVYAVDGRDIGRESYEGVAEIRRSGATYQMVWKIGPTAFVGTGLYAQGVLSVAFRDVDGRVLGLGVYSLQDDRSLAGVFTFVGSDRTGSEMLRPMKGEGGKPPAPGR